MQNGGYDPSLDEPKYTRRQLEETACDVAEVGYRRGWANCLDFIAQLPLTVCGRWAPDNVYPVHGLVQHGGDVWLAMVETASVPGPDNAFWRRVNHLKGMEG